MRQRGLIGVIILGVFVFLLVVGIAAGIYFYNFHVFKEIRMCVAEGEDTGYPCNSQEECLDLLNFSDDAVDGAPVFIRDNFENLLSSAVYCEDTCFVGMIRGINYESGDIEGLESCLDGEKEFLMEIRGKEGLEILKWMRGRN